LIKEIGVNSDHFLDMNVGNNQHVWKPSQAKPKPKPASTPLVVMESSLTGGNSGAPEG